MLKNQSPVRIWHGYGVSRKMTQMIKNHIKMYTATHTCIQKVKFMILCGMWSVNVCSLCYARDCKCVFWYPNNSTSLLFLNVLSIQYYDLNFWRYKASKRGRYFFDTLYSHWDNFMIVHYHVTNKCNVMQ